MPSYPEITTTGAVPTSSLPSAFLVLTRGVTTAEFEFDLWNDRTGAGAGTTTMRNVVFEPLYRYTVGGVYSREVDASLRQWMEINFPGTEQDPTAGTSGGLPGDYATYTTVTWIPMGGDAPFRVPALWPKQFARRFKLRMNVKGFGETESISRMVLKVTTNQGVWRLPLFSDAFVPQVFYAGDADQWNRHVAGRSLFGTRLRGGILDIRSLRIEGATWIVRHGEPVMHGTLEQGPFDLNAADFLLTGAAGLQEYKVLVTRKHTSTDATTAGFTFTKGNAASTGAAVLPTPPTGEIVVGEFTRAWPDMTPLVITTRIQPDLAYAWKNPTTPTLAVRLAARLANINGNAVTDDGYIETSTVNGTRYLHVDSAGVPSFDATARGAGKIPVAKVIAAGGDITSIEPLQMRKAPNHAWARWKSYVATVRPDMLDGDGEAYVFGRMRGNLVGVTVNAGTPQILQDVAGGHVMVEVLTLAAGPAEGALVLGDGVTECVLDGLGAPSVATETIMVSDETTDTNEKYVWLQSRNRWGGRGAQSPDVTLSAPGALDMTCNVYAACLEQFDMKLVQIRKAVLSFTPQTSLAQLRFRLYKVGRTGISTIWDTVLSGFGGTPATPRAFKAQHTDITVYDATDVPYDAAPPESKVDPLAGEGVFGVVSSIVDIPLLTIRLLVDPMVSA